MIDLAQRHPYTFWYSEKLRFSDTDMIGHVNNVAFAALIESGRVAFTRSGAIPLMPQDMLLVMARIEIDYRAELHFPAEVEIGSRVLRVGNSSFDIGNAVFHGESCAATSRTVLVAIDRQSRKSRALPDDMRAALEAA
jgi:acyl-CoA thioester hydrolase